MHKFLRISKVMERVPYSRATIYRKIAAGEFPRPYDLGSSGHAVAWLESDIDYWISQRIAAAEGKAQATASDEVA